MNKLDNSNFAVIADENKNQFTLINEIHKRLAFSGSITNLMSGVDGEAFSELPERCQSNIIWLLSELTEETENIFNCLLETQKQHNIN